MTQYKILDEAATDLDAAVAWYEEQREGLGLELFEEFRHRVKAAIEMSKIGTLIGHTPGGAEIRKYRFKKFKRYAVFVLLSTKSPQYSL